METSPNLNKSTLTQTTSTPPSEITEGELPKNNIIFKNQNKKSRIESSLKISQRICQKSPNLTIILKEARFKIGKTSRSPTKRKTNGFKKKKKMKIKPKRTSVSLRPRSYENDNRSYMNKLRMSYFKIRKKRTEIEGTGGEVKFDLNLKKIKLKGILKNKAVRNNGEFSLRKDPVNGRFTDYFDKSIKKNKKKKVTFKFDLNPDFQRKNDLINNLFENNQKFTNSYENRGIKSPRSKDLKKEFSTNFSPEIKNSNKIKSPRRSHLNPKKRNSLNYIYSKNTNLKFMKNGRKAVEPDLKESNGLFGPKGEIKKKLGKGNKSYLEIFKERIKTGNFKREEPISNYIF